MSTKWWPDVSNVNGRPIDAGLAKSQGAAAIAAKATEGTGFRDGLLAANHRAAVAAGLPFLAYHYPHSGNGAAQADWFVTYVAEVCGLPGVSLMIDREAADATTTDAFITEVRRLAPNNLLVGYEAAWVTERYGTSGLMKTLPLVWPNYPGAKTIEAVTPGWFQAFGGHTAYAARQYSDAGNCGGVSPCDLNVCFDDGLFAKMFHVSGAAAAAAAAAPPPKPAPLKDPGGHVLNGAGVAVEVTPTGKGYWFATTDGGVFAHGDAAFRGSAGNVKLNSPIVAMAADPAGRGYWLAAADGGVFAYGDTFAGSMGGKHLNAPIVDIVASAGGKGYWLVAADGGLFAFGDAPPITGNTLPATKLAAPIVGAAPAGGKGLWLAAADGGVFALGPGAAFYGSEGGKHLNAPIVDIAATPHGDGYWLVASDGGVFAFGAAGFAGSPAGHPINQPVVAMAPSPTGHGYVLVAKDLGAFTYGDAAFKGAGV